jgi:hypothetical protein
MGVSDKQIGIGRPDWGLGILADGLLQIGRAYGAEKSVLWSMIYVFPECPPIIELLKTDREAKSPAQRRRRDLVVEAHSLNSLKRRRCGLARGLSMNLRDLAKGNRVFRRMVFPPGKMPATT